MSLFILDKENRFGFSYSSLDQRKSFFISEVLTFCSVFSNVFDRFLSHRDRVDYKGIHGLLKSRQPIGAAFNDRLGLVFLTVLHSLKTNHIEFIYALDLMIQEILLEKDSTTYEHLMPELRQFTIQVIDCMI